LGKRAMEMVYWGLHPLADLIIAMGISANAVSWSSLVFGFASGVCLAIGHFGSAGVFATIASLLDALDGMVANATHTASSAGKMLDSALDRYVEFFFIAGLAVFYRDSLPLLVVALFALFASFMVSYSTALAEIQKIPVPNSSMRRPVRMTYLVLGAVLSPILDPAQGVPMILALILIAGVGNFSAFFRLTAAMRALRQRDTQKVVQLKVVESPLNQRASL
jgi:CDP-diacylglycerol---glycerol-3-phosphate 3-phosphatidyltransferase